MGNIFIIYKTDEKHSVESRVLVGVGDNIDQCLNISQLFAYEEKSTITIDDIISVGEDYKSVGYYSGGEFYYKLVEINTLIN
jgi:hypothetical protein